MDIETFNGNHFYKVNCWHSEQLLKLYSRELPEFETCKWSVHGDSRNGTIHIILKMAERNK